MMSLLSFIIDYMDFGPYFWSQHSSFEDEGSDQMAVPIEVVVYFLVGYWVFVGNSYIDCLSPESSGYMVS